MAAFEVIALDTATPQLRAPGASDTYTFPRAVEMPLGTANGVLYLNGSKVVTSGSALTFDGTTLALNANQTFDNARVLQWKNTSGVTRPVLQIFSDNNLYIDSEDGSQIFRTGGSEQMRLTSTGLGIGTSSPGQKLDVIGNAQIGNASTSAAVTRMYNQNSNLYVGVDSSTGGNTGTAYAQYFLGTGAYPMTFWTNTTERARIPAAGGMVIGTAALATTATDGFLYVPTCAGTPTGTPTTQTGTAPIVVDTTNNKLYFYSGGQWRDAGP